jgi:hypothetical protein
LILRWVKDENDEQYRAYSDNRTYTARLFEVGAYDGDPTLTLYDDSYRSTCWSLTIRVGVTTLNPVRLFNNRSSALFAAQLAEDNATEHRSQYSDVDDFSGRHGRGMRDENTVTITGRDGNTYTYWTRGRADLIGD